MGRPTTTTSAVAGASGSPMQAGFAMVAAVVLVALNLRAPIVSTSSVVEVVRTDLGVSATAAGLLTSLPVLCFAVATPPASWLIGRLGLERAVLVALALIGAGTVLRSVDGFPLALTGTVVIGVGITVGNVAVPVVIGRDFPHRHSAMLGVYTAALNIGSMITLAVTVPIADAAGWRWALSAWLVVVAVGIVGWLAAARRRSAGMTPAEQRAHDAAGDPDGPPWWRRPVVWGLTVAFAGQAFGYYGLTAWLPEILAALRGLDPASAGPASSIFQVSAVAGAVGVPVVRARANSLRAAFAVVAACWLALPVGLLLLPGAWPVWCALGGAAQGGGFTVIFSTILARARGPRDNRRISSVVQGGGYGVAALGPTVVGAVHEATSGWTVPLLAVTASLSLLAVAGLLSTGGVRAQPRQDA